MCVTDLSDKHNVLIGLDPVWTPWGLSQPVNHYQSQCTNSGAHRDNGMCVVISVPFEESVNIENKKRKKLPSGFFYFLFKQVVSYPQGWANSLFESLVGSTGIHISTQHRETIITHESLGMEEQSNRWEVKDLSLKTQMKVTIYIHTEPQQTLL